jgi:SAM-dependent methyltransferase
MTSPVEARSRSACIACGRIAVEVFIDFGETALANKFPTAAELDRPEARFPLRVGYCHACNHVQLTERVPPGAMFSDYLYVSSASETLRAHFADLSALLVEGLGLGPSDLVIDIGCNDASLLDAFRQLGVRTLGVDPAENLAALAAPLSIDRFVGFFGALTAGRIVDTWGAASLITATNTFPHIPELGDFLRGIETALAPGGTFLVEVHYLLDMIEMAAFDTIYHEHVSYWALGPMVRLFERHGLQAVRAERLPLHHGQLRVYVQRRGEADVDPSIERTLEDEHARGLDDFNTYVEFAARAMKVRSDLRALLGELKRSGHSVAAYGAPAKGSTLLEYVGVGPDDIRWIADRSSLKQGRFTPGSHIPIVGTERLVLEQPDEVLLLAWNFVDEVLAQQSEYRQRGGKFIVPVPQVHLV